jgi:bacteriorhodopsin
MERANLTPDYSPVASLAAMVSFVAAINYYAMKDMVGLDGSMASLAAFPTDYRYVDWLITTPLLLAMLPVLLGGRRFDVGLMARLVIADVLMIALGYVGEVAINDAGGGTMLAWWCLLGSLVLWFYILYELFAGIGRALEGASDEVARPLNLLRNFIVIGWLVYPLGYVVAALDVSPELLVTRELIYCIADVINKVGFGMVAVHAAKRLSLRQWQAGQVA